MATLLLFLSRLGRRTRAAQEGNSVVEYALILALIVIACLAALTMIGDTTAASLSRTASSIS